MDKRNELYRGKAKTVYSTDDPHRLVMHYRDDVSAFDGVKLAKLELKGETNNKINAYVMGKLAAAGVATHFVKLLNERESLVKAMKMVPVECVVRNVCAGSMAKRYGIEEGTRFQIQDRFRTTNAFHGGQIGLKGEHWRGRAVLGWNVSVAFGNVHQSIDIGGATRIASPGQPAAVVPGGLLALQSNSGRVDRDDFAVLPAVGVSAGVRLTNRLHVFAGYDFMYLSHVTRPGDVIDLTVNPALLPPPVGGGPARPVVLGGSSDYWMHGVAVGVEWRF